ncbi:MAG: hypothetical protein IH948_07860, partial [Bacteroidetes bacterium]|nr:hypothetical protein [Bacteroidota bacterium]
MRKNLNVIIGAFGMLSVFITLAFNLNEELKPNNKPVEAKFVKSNFVQDYMFNIRKNQITGKIDPADVRKARKAAKGSIQKSLGSLTWESRGPNNFAGRTRCILFDNSNALKIFIGSVSGGLFVSKTGGTSWIPVGDMKNMAVTSITQTKNGDIYVGTGEGFAYPYGDGSSGIGGQGVFKSTDGGVKFTQLPSTWPDDPDAWWIVNEMASNSTNSNKIYAATYHGLMVSENAGDTWNNAISAQTITLVGTGGTGTIKIGTSSYTINFDTDLDITALEFVKAKAGAILTNDNVAVVNMGSTLIFYDLDNSNPLITIANATGAVPQVNEIALIGTLGSADLYVDGSPYNLVFNADLDTTAIDFANTAVIPKVTVTSSGDTIILTATNPGTTFSVDSIVNSTGSVGQVDEYALTGSSGSAILTIDTIDSLSISSYQIVFDANLATTASNFTASESAQGILD